MVREYLQDLHGKVRKGYTVMVAACPWVPCFLSDCRPQNLVAQLGLTSEELLMVPVKNSVAGGRFPVAGQF